MTGTIRVLSQSTGQTINLDWAVGIIGRTTEINKGDTVKWTWTDSAPHNVASTSNPRLFESAILTGNGQTFSFKFDQFGTFPYICDVHPNTMTGTIVVRDPNQPSPSSSSLPQPSPSSTRLANPSQSRTQSPGPISPSPTGRPVNPPPSSTTAVLSWNTGVSGRTNFVYRGTTVRWNWTDNARHNVFSTSSPKAFDDSEFFTGIGIHFEHTFNRVGVYPYGCAVHGSMSGRIVVVEKLSCSGQTSVRNCKRFPGLINVGGTTVKVHQCRYKFNLNRCLNKRTGWQQRSS
jgi:plastocyanin